MFNIGRIIKRTLSSVPDISETISTKALLTGTGSGPFIELPTFQPIGNPTNLLNVKLPQSSNLNIRLGSIIAINGDLNDLSRVNRKLSDTTYYQVLQSKESTSLIVGGKLKPNRQNHYKLINTDLHDKWIIYKDENLISWTGYDFKLNKTKFLEKWCSFESSGRGIMLLSDGNQLIDINLQPGEKFIVDPNNLIASNNHSKFVILKNDSKLPSLPTISISWPQFIKKFGTMIRLQWDKMIKKLGLTNFIKELHHYLTRTKYFFQNGLLFLKLNLINRLFRRSIMVEFEGPSNLIISSNASASNTNNFGKREINTIFNQHRI